MFAGTNDQHLEVIDKSAKWTVRRNGILGCRSECRTGKFEHNFTLAVLTKKKKKN